ncbi:hypothetical protein MMC28_010787 [Mycoblastus sanguinarius]|nr:hypothetical protein [Mycoblastus sanguinarius]
MKPTIYILTFFSAVSAHATPFKNKYASNTASNSTSSPSNSANPISGGSNPAESGVNSTTNGPTYQATITGYGGNCGGQVGACGFLGSNGSYQCPVSAYWNGPGLPGQCGICWQLSDAKNANADGSIAETIGSAPIVVMVDNSCAVNPGDPTGSCNQSPSQPKDRWGSDTAVDLCTDTGAADALFGRPYAASEGGKGGIAVGALTQVDCGAEWKGSADPNSFASWSAYKATLGQALAVKKTT